MNEFFIFCLVAILAYAFWQTWRSAGAVGVLVAGACGVAGMALGMMVFVALFIDSKQDSDWGGIWIFGIAFGFACLVAAAMLIARFLPGHARQPAKRGATLKAPRRHR